MHFLLDASRLYIINHKLKKQYGFCGVMELIKLQEEVAI